ncbi:MAG: hypothetical protein AB2705_21145, partial [Candidatus Thiodiazotropha sp.]
LPPQTISAAPETKQSFLEEMAQSYNSTTRRTNSSSSSFFFFSLYLFTFVDQSIDTFSRTQFQNAKIPK